MFNEKKKADNCSECGSILELFELDVKKEVRIMKCKGCGLFYLYKNGVFGWKIQKVTRDPSHLVY